ncbi:hypothetical protein J2744_001459 [Halorubrum trapanicum]|uniref:Uncharacterized protein n=1 Tax=Halorubrum trapanicum TaxID=29284 RepID=A0A8J7RD11_9EURY|nr:hypothetical protein [Halorubrum trapanicum]MBP1901781.1 hypothetical protein [Halorubrum trapanicum]
MVDVGIGDDRMLATADRDDISVVVEVPAGRSEEELAETLDEVPAKIQTDRTCPLRGDR